MVAPLSRAEIDAALADLQHWTFEVANNAFRRDIVCSDFSEAFGIMTRIALEAEKLDHHPEWENVYNCIVVRLKTHDACDAPSHRDVQLAKSINRICDKIVNKPE